MKTIKYGKIAELEIGLRGVCGKCGCTVETEKADRGWPATKRKVPGFYVTCQQCRFPTVFVTKI